MADLIDRQEAFEALRQAETIVKAFGYSHVLETISELPSAQPQSTMGQVNDTAQSTNDYISRQAAIEVADAVWSVTGDKNVAKVWDQLKDLPSADAVVVVRCKDCKYASPNGIYGCRLERFSDDKSERLYAYDYCSHGERRADE